MTGLIKRLTDKGYGFIEIEGGQNVFFHASELIGCEYNDLREGDTMNFTMTESEKGPQATGVSRA